MVCTLGNFSTKLLRADTTGISRLHGREEVRLIGPRAVRLYPLYHPAAALYTPSMLETLRADFHRIPEMLALGAAAAAGAARLAPEFEEEPVPELEELAAEDFVAAERERAPSEPASQLGLF